MTDRFRQADVARASASRAFQTYDQWFLGLRIGLAPTQLGLDIGLDIGLFRDILYSVLLLDAILGLDFLGRALSRPQVVSRDRPRPPRRDRLRVLRAPRPL